MNEDIKYIEEKEGITMLEIKELKKLLKRCRFRTLNSSSLKT